MFLTGLVLGFGDSALFYFHFNIDRNISLILSGACVSSLLTWMLAHRLSDPYRLIRWASLLQCLGWLVLLLDNSHQESDRSTGWVVLGLAVGCLLSVVPTHVYQVNGVSGASATCHLTTCWAAGAWLAELLNAQLGFYAAVVVCLVVSILQCLLSLNLSHSNQTTTDGTHVSAHERKIPSSHGYFSFKDTTFAVSEAHSNPPVADSSAITLAAVSFMPIIQHLVGVGFLPIAETICVNFAHQPRDCNRLYTGTRLLSLLIFNRVFAVTSDSKDFMLIVSSFALAGGYQLLNLSVTRLVDAGGVAAGNAMLYACVMVISVAGAAGWLQIPLLRVLEQNHRQPDRCPLHRLMFTWLASGLLLRCLYNALLPRVTLSSVLRSASVCFFLAGTIILLSGWRRMQSGRSALIGK